MIDFGILLFIAIVIAVVAFKSQKTRSSSDVEEINVPVIKGYLYSISSSSKAQHIHQCLRCGVSTFTKRKNFDLVEFEKNHRLVYFLFLLIEGMIYDLVIAISNVTIVKKNLNLLSTLMVI